MTVPPINLINYHLLGDGKPHSRETKQIIKAKLKPRKRPADFLKFR